MNNRVFNNYLSNRVALYLTAGHTATPPGHKPEMGVKARHNYEGNKRIKSSEVCHEGG